MEQDILRIESYGQENKTFELDGATKVRSIYMNSTDRIQLSFASDSTVEHSGFHLRIRMEGMLSVRLKLK